MTDFLFILQSGFLLLFQAGAIQIDQDISTHTTVGYDISVTVSDGKNTVGPRLLTITFAGKVVQMQYVLHQILLNESQLCRILLWVFLLHCNYNDLYRNTIKIIVIIIIKILLIKNRQSLKVEPIYRLYLNRNLTKQWSICSYDLTKTKIQKETQTNLTDFSHLFSLPDINDPVALTNLPVSTSVIENVAVGTTVYTVSYSDQDTTQSHVFSMTSSPASGHSYFTIDQTSKTHTFCS